MLRLLLAALVLGLAAASAPAAQSARCPTGFEIPNGATDGDGDCVPDDIEVTGYAYDASGGGALAACTPGPADCYVTDPTTWSSDGDPYSDFQEATGINLPTIQAPYGHPLVAASPKIFVDLVGYAYTPKLEIRDSRGGSLSEGTSVSVGTSSTTSLSASIGSEVSLVDPKITSEITASESETVSRETTTSVDREFNWETATSEQFDEAASLALDIRVRNEGSATALNVKPRFNVYIGGELIATIQTPEAFQTTLGPGETSTDVIRVDRRDTGGVTPEEIVLSIPQLRKLRRGAPVELRMVSLEAEVLRWTPGTNNWSCGSASSPCLWSNFQREIEARTLRLNVDFGYSGDPDANVPSRYRSNPYEFDVFTGSPRVDPEFTLTEVLGFIGFAEGSGSSFAISGRPFPGRWVALSGPDPGLDGERFLDHWLDFADAQGDASWPGDLLSMPMPREANLILLNPAPEPGEAGPVVTGARFSAEQRSVTVSADAKGGFRPVSATAHLFVQGEEIVVDMVPAGASPDGSGVTFSLPEPHPLPIAAGASYVVVRDGLGYERITTLDTPFGTPTTCDDVPRSVFANAQGDYLPNFDEGNTSTVFVGGDANTPASVFCGPGVNGPETYYWAPQNHGTGDDTLFREVAVLDAAHRVVVGNEIIARTEDGGQSWIRVPFPSGVPASTFFLGLAFREGGAPGAEVGIAVSREGPILRTKDGGRTWTRATVTGGDVYLEAVDYAGVDTWYAVGGGRIRRSIDDGRTWQPQALQAVDENGNDVSRPDFENFTAVEFISETEGVVGDNRMADDVGRIYATTDGGVTWRETAAYTGHHDIAYNGRDGWLIVGDQGIWFQENLLATEPVKYQVLPANGARFWAVDFATPEIGFAVDYNESQNIVRADDGGRGTWTSTSGYPGNWQRGTQRLIGIDMLDANVGAVAGYGGVLGATDSGAGAPTYTTRGGVASEDGPEADRSAVGLDPSYPNPVRGLATVPFRLGAAGPARLAVYDLLGREVAVLTDGPLAAGRHEVRFDASRLASGVYIVRLVSGDAVAVRRVAVVR